MTQQKAAGPGRPRGGGGHMGPGAMGGPVIKAKDFKGTLKRLVQYLKPQRLRFILVFIMAISSTVFNIFGPKVMGKATTKLGEGIMARYSY